MPGNNQLGAGAEGGATIGRYFGGFNFDVDGAGAVLDGEVEDAQLLFDAAVEAAVILVAAARGDDCARRVFVEKRPYCLCRGRRIGHVIQPEFQEVFAGFHFAASLFEKPRYIRQAERDTDFW